VNSDDGWDQRDTSANGETSFYRTSKILKIFKLLRLLKLFRVLRMNRILSRLEAQLSIKYGLLKCIKFTIVIMVSAHILACAFAYVAELQDGFSWMHTVCESEGKCLSDLPASEQYLASVYWAMTTMSTIGYGDITAVTTEERVVALFCMSIGAAIFAYGITNMCTLVANLNTQDVMFRQRMDMLHEFFEYRSVPAPLQARAREFFHYKRNSSMMFEQEPHLLNAMSLGLRRDLLLFINKDLIQRTPFLRDATNQLAIVQVRCLSRPPLNPLYTPFRPPLDPL
jgi:hypothetical protein